MSRKFCKTCQESSNPDDTRASTNSNTRAVSSYTDALYTGQKWPSTDLKYYFYTTSDDAKTDSENVRNWTNTQKDNWRAALESWQKVSTLTFTETGTIGETDIKLILVDDNTYPYLGHAYFPGGSAKGENYVSYNNAADKDFTVGSYDYITMVHEFGHTLGLAHPHDTGGTSTQFPGVSNWWNLGTNQQNQTIYTVMSYNDLNGPLTPDNVQSFGFIGGPMAYDIKTIQLIYAGNVDAETGNTVYTVPTTNASGTFFSAIHDTGGIDTIDAGNATTSVTINLNDATLNAHGGNLSKVDAVDGGFTIASGTNIENATGGSAGDRITGNENDNTIEGNAGNDTLFGASGDDNLQGGTGDDRIYDGSGDDIVVGGDGHDRFYTGAGNDNVDGGSGNDRFYAGPGEDVFEGGTGRNVLYLPGRRSNYSITQFSDRTEITGLGSYYASSGKTTIRNITRIKFSRYRKQVVHYNSSYRARPGTQRFEGNETLNTAYFRGRPRNYRVYKYNDGRTLLVGRGKYFRLAGRTTLKGVKYAKFSRYRRRSLVSRLRRR